MRGGPAGIGKNKCILIVATESILLLKKRRQLCIVFLVNEFYNNFETYITGFTDSHSSNSILVVHLLNNFHIPYFLHSTQLASNKLTGKLKIKVIANLPFSPNNVITNQVKFHRIWICLKRSHNSYCFLLSCH